MYTSGEGWGGRVGGGGEVAEDIFKGEKFFRFPLLSKRKSDNSPPA